MRIPTAITRYKVETEQEPFVSRQIFTRPINFQSNEVCCQYRFPHIVIRWSPISIAITRLFTRLR